MTISDDMEAEPGDSGAVVKLREALAEAADHFDQIARKARYWMEVCATNEIAVARWSRLARHASHRAVVARAALEASKP